MGGTQIFYPSEFYVQELEDKLQGAWQTEHLDPQLVREDEVGHDSEQYLDIKGQHSLVSQVTNQWKEKAAVNEEAKRIMDEQNKCLTDDQRKELDKKMKELKLCSRWLPDSSMTTYFGKPAFFAYGNGNTRPASGGAIYG